MNKSDLYTYNLMVAGYTTHKAILFKPRYRKTLSNIADHQIVVHQILIKWFVTHDVVLMGGPLRILQEVKEEFERGSYLYFDFELHRGKDVSGW